MRQDIRDRPSLRHEDVSGLNFISNAGKYYFRRHFRQGLRSHVMEVLTRAEVDIENRGTLIDGARWFPRARPRHMLRLFRSRLETLEKALAEIKRVKVVEAYLGPEFMAESSEFVVDYHGPSGTDIMLCGFQAYVAGEILDPWSLLDGKRLLSLLFEKLYAQGKRTEGQRAQWVQTTKEKSALFVRRVKQMIAEVGHIPDLAGSGNLMMQKTGEIRLVDINNISPVSFDPEIRLDDKGYPVCDKSIEALSLIETKILGEPIDRSEPIYRTFLDPDRIRQVKIREERFYRNQSG